MLHSGHITFLKRAAEYGRVYVGIGSDYSVLKYKCKSPVCSEQERLFMLKAIRYVEDAFINDGEGEMDFIDTILDLGIKTMIVNEDQSPDKKKEFCQKHGIECIVLTRTQEPELPARSTTNYRHEVRIGKW